ncbi:MAG: signal recognition particle-docking protein FtsY [Nanoarchaeota archaeon]|nr:signal recognition particle-docking protein FtsY [Nanoarchaeota archaeon]
MFKFLKEKLKSWTKKITKAEKEKSESPQEKKKLEKKNKPAKKQAKEIPMPLKFDLVKRKYEPDLDQIKNIEKQLEEKEEAENKEEPIPGERGFIARIKSRITKIKLDEKQFDIYAEELENLLLENNVALEVAEKIIKELKEKIVGKELLKKELEEEVKDSFKEIIREILIEPFDVAKKVKEKMKSQESKEPYVILFFGINGTGKTTTIAKVAHFLKKQGISCILAAADTFRAASIEQLKEHGEKVGVKVINHDYGSDPASVCFDAVQYAKKHGINCVLIDTAGRMHTSKDLLREIEKISKVSKPDLKIFVGESLTGNDVLEQAKSFDSSIGIDGIILTKADVDEKGGTALSVGYILKKPILYLGTGQAYSEIEPFDKEKFIKRLGL